ncbi:MAG: hypothetical protein ACYTFV_00915 [Planctomycetota bacterium]|jgi:hypothetical protein
MNRPQQHLLQSIDSMFSHATSPEVRWLARECAEALPIGMPKFTTLNGLHAARGIHIHGTAQSKTIHWSFLLERSSVLQDIVNRPDAFVPRDEEWPLQHIALDLTSPFVWAGSYLPVVPNTCPLLGFRGLDELTAWALNLTDTVDVARARRQLDIAMTMPGFRTWIERINILPAPLPRGVDAHAAMELRFEFLDAPLRDPCLASPRTRKHLRPDQGFEPEDLPRFSVPSVPFSNAKSWAMLIPAPATRWSLAVYSRRPKKLKTWQQSVPYTEPTGSKTEVKVADVYFRSMYHASLFFRIPYETLKSRMGRGQRPERALELDPMYFKGTGFTRATSYRSHWHKKYAVTDQRWSPEDPPNV